MSERQFDVMEVNTDLAKKYFKNNNYKFSSKSLNENQTVKDGYGNTIFYEEVQTFPTVQGPNVLQVLPWNRDDVEDKLRKLAELIEKNCDLFCQIEYLVRKIPIDEVRNYDIKLIVQNLTCSDRQMTLEQGQTILMDENTPLANLGYAAQLVHLGAAVHLVASKSTAVVTHLFAELCHSVGLDSVQTFFLPSDKIKEIPKSTSMDTISAFQSGCIGVVTERCDVDSAIDTFLQTTTRYPWKLHRILVEESVFNTFSKAIAWKAGLKPDQLPSHLQSAADRCSGAFAYNGKTFLVDYAGPASDGILVEAYRTTKELLSFLKKHHAMFLSLWASDMAQANEIAHSVTSSVVWINSYGVFDGPPQTSKAIYTEIAWSNTEKTFGCSKGNLLKGQEVWANMSFEERRKIVQNATDEFYNDTKWPETMSEDKEKDMNFLKKLRIALRNIKSENFVCVENTRMCMGFSLPVKYCSYYFDAENGDLELFARALTSGSAIIYYVNFNCFADRIELYKYLDRLATRIPITKDVDNSIPPYYKDDSFNAYWRNLPLAKTKVIWTNFGTIFAN